MNAKVDNFMKYSPAVILLVILGISVYLLYPRTPLIIHTYEVYNDISLTQNRSIKSYEIKAGEDIEFEISFSKRADVICEVTLLLSQVDNGYTFPYDDMPRRITRMPVKDNQHYKHVTHIPAVTPKGRYVFTRSYHCGVNPLQTYVTSIKSNEFDVVGKVRSQLDVLKEANKISQETNTRVKNIETEIKRKK